MKTVGLIVAVSDNGVIGHDNQLLWHLPNDLKWFKKVTLGKSIIMGRKTYESIGKPLPGRQNIVLTNSESFEAPCDVVHSIEAALAIAEHDVMVIGGAQIYRLFYPAVTRMWLTKVHTQINGDTAFIDWDSAAWQEVFREAHEQDAQHAFAYTFFELQRL